MKRYLDPDALDALAPGLREDIGRSVNEMLDYIEGEWGGSNGMIGESANVVERAYAVLKELRVERAT